MGIMKVKLAILKHDLVGGKLNRAEAADHERCGDENSDLKKQLPRCGNSQGQKSRTSSFKLQSRFGGKIQLTIAGQRVAKNATSMTVLEMVVARPEPATPMAGTPRCPKTNTQLPKAFRIFAPRKTIRIGPAVPVA